MVPLNSKTEGSSGGASGRLLPHDPATFPRCFLWESVRGPDVIASIEDLFCDDPACPDRLMEAQVMR